MFDLNVAEMICFGVVMVNVVLKATVMPMLRKRWQPHHLCSLLHNLMPYLSVSSSLILVVPLLLLLSIQMFPVKPYHANDLNNPIRMTHGIY